MRLLVLLSFLTASAGAFKVYDVPLNWTNKYRTVDSRKRLDLVPGLPTQPHSFTSYGKLVQSDLPQGAILNGLIEAVHLACTNHHILKLSPDAIFFAIMQSITDIKPHDPNFKTFFSPPARNKVVGSLTGGWKDNDEWPMIVEELSSYESSKYTLDVAADIHRPFSTSMTDNASLHALFMKSHGPYSVNPKTKQHSSLSSSAKCEVPEIQLTGTLEDWREVKRRAESLLTHFELDRWKANLVPVLIKFVTAKQGSPDVAFWKDIYKRQSSRNPSLVSGWINVFFPTYLMEDGYETNECFLEDLSLCTGHPLGSYPLMALDYPFQMGHWFKRYPADLVYALYGAHYSSSYGTIEPIIGYSVFVGESTRIDDTPEEYRKFEKTGRKLHGFNLSYCSPSKSNVCIS